MKFLISIVAWVLAIDVAAQNYKIGDRVAIFSLLNASDNTKISLTDYVTTKGVVVVFTNNTCPYSRLYETRIISLAQEFQEKNIKFILINPTVSTELQSADNGISIGRKSRENNYPFPYLLDNAGLVGRTFGATKTPECFVLKNVGGNFHLFYKGAIDDNPQVGDDVTNNYLRIALIGLMDNATLMVKEKRAAGCIINY